MRTLLMSTFVASVLFMSPAVQAQGNRAGPPRAMGGTNVAVIDVNYIFKHHLRFKQRMDEIKQDIESFEAKLGNERARITKETERLKGLPAGGDEYRRLETDLATAHTGLQLETGRKRKEILEREAKVYYNAYKEIEDYVGRFALRNSIGLVLRFSSEDMDPTKRESVLQGVNRAVVYQYNLNISHLILNDLNEGTPPPQQRGDARTGGRSPIPGRR